MYKKLILFLTNILKKLYHVSLYGKILGLIIMIAVFISFFTIIRVYYVFHKESNLQLKALSKTIAQELSYQSVSYIKDNNIMKLMRIIENVKYHNKDIRYIFIENNKGKVIASTFENGFPLKLLKINNHGFKKISIVKLKNLYDGVWDSSYPILRGKLGVVRVGVLTKYSKILVNSFIGSLIFTIILIMFISIIVFSAIIMFMTRPIVKLTKALHDVEHGDLTVELKEVYIVDEIGELTHAFNKMIKRLRDAEAIKLEKNNKCS